MISPFEERFIKDVGNEISFHGSCSSKGKTISAGDEGVQRLIASNFMASQSERKSRQPVVYLVVNNLTDIVLHVFHDKFYRVIKDICYVLKLLSVNLSFLK